MNLHPLMTTFAGFCIATVLTQAILGGYFVLNGNLNRETATKLVALLHGIDISGNRLQQILRQSDAPEQPDFEEVLQSRALKSYDMDLRLRSQAEHQEDLTGTLAEIRVERDRLDERLETFHRQLAELRDETLQHGLREVQKTIQSLDPEQAKEQLMLMLRDERMDDVVTIVQAMPTEKRKDILAEFVSKDEAEQLAEILRRIGEGEPASSLIEQAAQGS